MIADCKEVFLNVSYKTTYALINKNFKKLEIKAEKYTNKELHYRFDKNFERINPLFS